MATLPPSDRACAARAGGDVIARALLLVGLAGCAASFSADDQKSADIGTRSAAELLDICATDDAGTCIAPVVRARARIIFCASQHSLSAHSTPFDGGPPCH